MGKDTPKWTMRKKYQVKSDSNIPGVGLYNIEESFKGTQTSSKKATLKGKNGTFLDVKRLSAISPGPAQYQSKLSEIGGKNSEAVTMKGKKEHSLTNKNPGPGTYDLRFNL